jgi:arabinogalactan endo-1,4-beta-galactosidase
MSTAELIAMPEGDRIAWCQQHLWPYVGKLLAAAADGVRSVAGRGARFSTHVSDFGQRSPAVQLAFWQTAKSVGYEPDLFGTSYYPTDGRTDLGAADRVAWLRGIAQGLHATYGRKLFISEYGYPSSLMQPPYIFNDTVRGYPQTEQGQYAFLHDLVTWGVQSGLLAGIRPWAPDYCTNSGWAPMALFNLNGSEVVAKPALHAIQDALKPFEKPACKAPRKRRPHRRRRRRRPRRHK